MKKHLLCMWKNSYSVKFYFYSVIKLYTIILIWKYNGINTKISMIDFLIFLSPQIIKSYTLSTNIYLLYFYTLIKPTNIIFYLTYTLRKNKLY